MHKHIKKQALNNFKRCKLLVRDSMPCGKRINGVLTKRTSKSVNQGLQLYYTKGMLPCTGGLIST